MQETQNELIHLTIGVYLYSNNGELGNTKEQNYTEYNKCKYIQRTKHLTVFYLLDGPTDTHTHTHTQEMVADAFNADFSSEGQMS